MEQNNINITKEEYEYLNKLWETSDNLLIGIMNYKDFSKDEFGVKPLNFNGEKIKNPYKLNEYIETVFGCLMENPILNNAEAGDIIIFKYIKNNYECRYTNIPILVEPGSVILGIEVSEKHIALPTALHEKKIEYIRYLKSIDRLKTFYKR